MFVYIVLDVILKFFGYFVKVVVFVNYFLICVGEYVEVEFVIINLKNSRFCQEIGIYEVLSVCFILELF